MANQFSYFQKAFRGALSSRHPRDYPEFIESLLKYDNDIWRPRHLKELAFVLFRDSSEQLLATIPHKNPLALGISRDRRLLAWFQACEDAGVDIGKTLAAHIAEHSDFTPALKPLIRSQAIQTMLWWRQRGLEDGISLPCSGAKTNLATLAFYYGRDDVGCQLLPGSTLEHLDVLWSRVWRNDNLHRSERMADILLQYGPPPPGFLKKLPVPAINIKNASSVIGLSRRLVDENHCSLSSQQATHELVRVVKNLRSPASVGLVQMYLHYGANLDGTKPLDPLPSLLDSWSRVSLTNVLQPSYQKCVELVLEKMTPAQQDAVLTPSRIKHLTKSFEDQLPKSGTPTPAQEITLATNRSILRRIALGQISRDPVSRANPAKTMKI